MADSAPAPAQSTPAPAEEAIAGSLAQVAISDQSPGQEDSAEPAALSSTTDNQEDSTKDSDTESNDEVMGSYLAKDKENYGKRCRIRNVYEAPREDFNLDGEPSWQDEMPDGMRKSAESEPRWRKYALLLRNSMSSGSLKRHSIVIHSPHIRKQLNRVLKGYAGVPLEREILELPAPFQPIFFHWSELKDAAEGKVPDGVDPLSELEKEHMKLLIDTLEPEFKQAWEAQEQFKASGKIDFDNLWTLFPAKSVVISSSGPRMETSYILRNTERFVSKRDGQVYFILRTYMVSFDGLRYGMRMNPLAINHYIGVRSLVELNICPLELHPNKDALRERLISRGKTFQKLTQMTYALYEGSAVECIDATYEKPKVYAVSGRVIIDVEAFVKFNPGLEPTLLPLNFLEMAWDPRVANLTDTDGYSLGVGNRYYPDDKERVQEAAISDLRQPQSVAYGRSLRKPLPDLSEDYLLICDHVIQGFSMSLKRWLMFKVDLVKPLVWNTRAFSSLSLPADQKKVLLSFARSQAHSQTNKLRSNVVVEKGDVEESDGFDTLENPGDDDYAPFDDVITGKGKGFVVLLEGPPGVGKTLTVESIAEEMRVPLYSVGAGELGSYSGTVESNLERILDMAQMWNAVVLLDEADIFLEARTTDQMDRNQIVSIFLRLLEYFQGTIFLTTNRVDSIDPAFESRIHLWLPYTPLGMTNRVDIWKSALGGVRLPLDAELTGAIQTGASVPPVLRRLSEMELNGREIKNMVKMASLLASAQQGPMTGAHLEEIVEIWRPRLERRGERKAGVEGVKEI